MKTFYFIAHSLFLAGFAVLFSGCEEHAYFYSPEPPPAIYGFWEATNPEALGVDQVTLTLHEDGSYRYFASIDHFEMDELGQWDFNGHQTLCFYSDYINGRSDETAYEARFELLDCDLIKIVYDDVDCQCPLYLERLCD